MGRRTRVQEVMRHTWDTGTVAQEKATCENKKGWKKEKQNKKQGPGVFFSKRREIQSPGGGSQCSNDVCMSICLMLRVSKLQTFTFKTTYINLMSLSVSVSLFPGIFSEV